MEQEDCLNLMTLTVLLPLHYENRKQMWKFWAELRQSVSNVQVNPGSDREWVGREGVGTPSTVRDASDDLFRWARNLSHYPFFLWAFIIWSKATVSHWQEKYNANNQITQLQPPLVEKSAKSVSERRSGGGAASPQQCLTKGQTEKQQDQEINTEHL